MQLGQVNIFRKSLSRFKEIVSQEFRRQVLCTVICNEISRLKKINKKRDIKILDYGSGFNPILIKKIINALTLKHKKTKFKAYCYDYYSTKQLKNLNTNQNIIYSNISKFSDKHKFDFCLIVDVLHHMDLENKTNIYRIIKKLKKRSSYLIIKDHFQHGLISNLVLIMMDFFSNYGDGTMIPKKYFSTKSFEKLVHKAKLTEVKRIDNMKYYKWYWLYINNEKLQFISILK